MRLVVLLSYLPQMQTWKRKKKNMFKTLKSSRFLLCKTPSLTLMTPKAPSQQLINAGLRVSIPPFRTRGPYPPLRPPLQRAEGMRRPNKIVLSYIFKTS